MEKLLGTDVSWCQGSKFGWSLLKQSGIIYAFIKATDGMSTDGQFVRNATEAIKHLEFVSFYHWFQPSIDPIKQARHFVRTIRPYYGFKNSLPLALDFEDDDGGTVKGKALLDAFMAFLNEVERLTGKTAVVYTGKWFWEGSVGMDSEEMAKRPLWHAQYPGGIKKGSQDYKTAVNNLGLASIAKPWASRGLREAFWQFDGDGGLVSPDGIDIDVNVFYGTEEELRAFCAATYLGEPALICPHDLSSVKGTQAALAQLGYTLTVDGVFGPKSRAAVRDFQSKNSLDADGVIGSNTVAAIEKALGY